jgi:hypothetical protein
MSEKPVALGPLERELAELFARPGWRAAPRHDYVKLGAWLFALLFGPALLTVTALIISGLA